MKRLIIVVSAGLITLSSSYLLSSNDQKISLLRKPFTRIDRKSDDKILNTVFFVPVENAEIALREMQHRFEKLNTTSAHILKNRQAANARLMHKYWFIQHQLKQCQDTKLEHDLRLTLKDLKIALDVSRTTAAEEESVMDLKSAFQYQAMRTDLNGAHAVLLRAQNEQLKKQLKEKEAEWKKEKELLLKDIQSRQ